MCMYSMHKCIRMVWGKSNFKKTVLIHSASLEEEEQRNWTGIAHDGNLNPLVFSGRFIVVRGNYVNCKAGEVAVYSITVNHIQTQLEAAQPVRECVCVCASPQTDIIFAPGLNIKRGCQSK